MRSTLAALLLIAAWVPALADDVKDCDYWRLGKDEAEKAALLKVSDVVATVKSVTYKG